ncbi:MAG: glycosyltransferase family 4 protein [Flavobacteriales bacterium]
MPDRILVFSDWFSPGFRAGGPIRSLVNLTEALGLPFDIITRNTDHYSSTTYDLPVGEWVQHSAHVRVMYLPAAELSLSQIRNLMQGDYRWIYLNSLWSPRFTILPLIAASLNGKTSRIIIAPRGMLKAAALAIKAPKKKLLLALMRLTGVASRVLWHATSEEERGEIILHMGAKSNIKVAANLPAIISAPLPAPAKKPGEMQLICIARISAEKGILEALEFLKSVQQLGRIRVDFYGTLQDEKFLSLCRERAAALKGIDCFFHGELPPSDIAHRMQDAHFFYLPTRGENYGHAIIEALQYGRPVIISDRTPWKFNEDDAAGFSLPLNSESFYPALKHCLDMDQPAYNLASDAASAQGKKIVSDPAVLEASRHIFD